MKSLSVYAKGERGLSEKEIEEALREAIGDPRQYHRVLILPPDYTRFHSNAGLITRLMWNLLSSHAKVEIMPALGSHRPMTREEWYEMFGDIPFENMLVHNWRTDVETIGVIPSEVLERLSEGTMHDPVEVQLDRRLLNPAYDAIFSIGQVVPHEVVGMANRNKNLFVGCGGAAMINASHMLGAFYGLERIMGKDHTPVRDLFDLAEAQFATQMPITYFLTVTDASQGSIRTHGLFIGRERERFEEAVALSQRVNMIRVSEPLKKCVVNLDAREFHSIWLGNKAIYRTRMAMADGGELIILAPAVERFGEDDANDRLIRKYGYVGREAIIRLTQLNADLQENLSAAAHLIHGSSDGRFKITYCTRLLSEAEVRGVGFDYMPYDEAARRYAPEKARDEGFYYIENPALGLWTV